MTDASTRLSEGTKTGRALPNESHLGPPHLAGIRLKKNASEGRFDSAAGHAICKTTEWAHLLLEVKSVVA